MLRGGALDNLIERSGDIIRFNHFYTFEVVHLRYLSFDMRQFIWKSLLFDPLEYKNYSKNLQGSESALFTSKRDEPLILLDLNRILLSERDWCKVIRGTLQKEQLNLEIIKDVLVYTSNVLGKSEVLANESYYYMLGALIYVFRSYDMRYKYQHIASMFLTLIRNVHQPINISHISTVSEFIADFYTLNGVFIHSINRLDPDIGAKLKELMKIRADPSDRIFSRKLNNLKEDILLGDSIYFFSPISR